MAKISIIVPIYNQASYLAKCLHSLRKQTMQDIEVVLVDDGSTDESAKTCIKVIEMDARFHYFYQENGGPTAARNLGICHASAKYVTFLDGDDWVEPAWCQKLYDSAVNAKTELVICGHFRDQDGKAMPQHSALAPRVYDREAVEQEIFPNLFHDDFEDDWTIYPYLWDKLFLREKLLPWMKAVDDDIRLGEDACVTFSYLVSCKKISVIDDFLYHYVQHANSGVRALMKLEHDLPHYRWMYHFVCKSWQGTTFDNMLRSQWRRYLLTTILLPRMPFLWNDSDGRECWFPFFQVERASRVVIYGAGVFGTACRSLLQMSGYAKPVLWLDARAEALQKEGLPVYSMGSLSHASYDVVVVAILRSSTVRAVCRSLRTAGVPEEKICILNKSMVLDEHAWKAYGMND